MIQFNSTRNTAVHPGQALGTALRNHAKAYHPDSGSEEGAVGWQGQPAPGWDLSEQGFEVMMNDMGFASSAEYIQYKAETSVPAGGRPKL